MDEVRLSVSNPSLVKGLKVENPNFKQQETLSCRWDSEEDEGESFVRSYQQVRTRAC